MTILALDTSSQAASCALLRDGSLAGEFFINVALTHSQTILPMVESMLESTGISIDEVDAFSVSSGPGSFTGLRIGISAVKGMAMAKDKPCLSVSTLEGLAWNLTAFSGVIIPAMDARREQVYTAAFSCEKGLPSRLWEDTALSLADLKAKVETLSPGPVLLVGDGAQLCRSAWEGMAQVSVAPPQLLHQRAGSIAFAACHAMENGAASDTAHSLAPAYLRLPQAERERLAKLQR